MGNYPRRRFIGLLASGMVLLPSAEAPFNPFSVESSLLADEAQQPEFTPVSLEELKLLGYTKILARDKFKRRQKTAHLEYYLREDFWNTLPKQLSKKELYDSLKQAPFTSVTTVQFEGVSIIRPGAYITSKDFLKEFMEGMQGHINIYQGENQYELDPNLRFADGDQEKIQSALTQSLTSPITSQEADHAVHKFPYGSQVHINVLPQQAPTISLFVNIGTKNDPSYTKKIVTIDEKTRDVFNKIQYFSLLKDPIQNFTPIDVIYEKYLARKEKN